MTEVELLDEAVSKSQDWSILDLNEVVDNGLPKNIIISKIYLKNKIMYDGFRTPFSIAIILTEDEDNSQMAMMYNRKDKKIIPDSFMDLQLSVSDKGNVQLAGPGGIIH